MVGIHAIRGTHIRPVVPVSIYDHDKDGLPDDYDPDYQAIYFNADGTYKLDVWPSATLAD